jgi:hypothetical protein
MLKNIFFISIFLASFAYSQVAGTIFMTKKDRNNITNLQVRVYSLEVSTNNLQSQIGILMDEVYYVLPSVSWTASSSGIYEIGSTKANIDLGFTVNKEMVTRTYSGGYSESLGPGSGNVFTLISDITGYSVFTVTVTDVRAASANSSQILYFRNRKYYGASGTYPLSNPEILALTTGWETKGNSSAGMALSDQYIYVAYPARLGLCTSFSLGGFATSPWPYETVSVMNASGYPESFYIYRSANKLTSGSMSYDIH